LPEDPVPDAEPADLAAALGALVGGDHVITGDGAAAYAVEGVVPRAVVAPGSVDELSQVLAFAHRHRLVTVPWGSGSQMHLGMPPERVDLVCSLARFNRLIEYEPADMTVAVEAGMSLAELQRLLGERGQFLPLDPPTGPGSTVGGCLATRAAGPLRAGFGTLRDRLLGVRVVLPDGRIAKAGGRVVKNVAGYELGRLYTGALGTLAVVAEIYLKVQPLPASWAALKGPLDGAGQVEAALAALMDSEAEGVAMEVVEPAMAAALGWEPRWHLALAFAGTAAETAYLLERSREVVGEATGAPGNRWSAEAVPWPELHSQLLAAHRGTAPGNPDDPDGTGAVTVRVNLVSDQIAAFLDEAVAGAARAGMEARGIAHGFNGIARIHVAASRGGDRAALVREWRQRAETLGGSLVVERAPAELKRAVDVWGLPRDGFSLMKGLKEAFDPHGILNAGRFVGGL